MELMSSPAFDTLKAAKALRAAGFNDNQAEAVIATVGDAVGGNIATKADLQELRTATQAGLQRLKADFQELRTATQADLQRLKADFQELRTATQADLQRLKADFQELRTATQADLQALELRITHKFESLYKHLWAMSVGIVTAVVALMKLLL